MSYVKCEACKEPFLTEADPYGVWPSNDGAYLYCASCLTKVVNNKFDSLPKLKFKLQEGAKLPEYKTPGAAGMDVSACISCEYGHEIVVPAHGWKLIPTGISVDIPAGYEIQVRSRSGLAFKQGIFVINAPGTVDEDYKGEIGVILANFGGEGYVVKHNDRIAQLVLSRVDKLPIVTTEILSESERGDGGFGSTGE